MACEIHSAKADKKRLTVTKRCQMRQVKPDAWDVLQAQQGCAKKFYTG